MGGDRRHETMTRSIGVQSFTYRHFENDEIATQIADTGVEAIELCGVHVEPEEDPEQIERDRSLYADHGIDICGFGVHDIEASTDVDRLCSFAADELGAEYLSIHVDPDLGDGIDRLVDAATDHDLLLAIHNHGPGHVHDTVEDLEAVYTGKPTRLGACVDTGHFLRSGIAPGDSIPRIGERVHAVHFKDFAADETEVTPGDGQLDVAETLSLLDEHTNFDQPLVIEYEEDAEDPTPAVEEIIRRVRAADET
jgi:sugar phosphate isomerase/epimerase